MDREYSKNMKNIIDKISTAAVAFSMAACASKPYLQLQYAQGKGENYHETGKTNLSCARVRGGGETLYTGLRPEEFRLGIDVCYSRFPTVTTVDSFGIEASFFKEETTIQSITKQHQVKLNPIVEYKLFTIGANLPKDYTSAFIAGLQVPGHKNVELSLWLGAGYNLDITAKSTDFIAGDAGNNQIKNIPSIEIDGRFFGELSHELILLGRIPLGASIGVYHGDGTIRYSYLFNGGYRIQW